MRRSLAWRPPRVIHCRVHVGEEAVFGRLHPLPRVHRLVLVERHADDGLHALEAVLPRHHEADGRAVLVGQHLAVKTDGHDGERVHGLVHPQALHVGPRQRRLGLPRHLLRVHERGEPHELRLRCGLEALHEIGQREAHPRNDHGPRLDAAHAVDALLEREPLHDVFHVVGAGLAALPFHHHAPGARLERARVPGRVALVEAELVEVVVGGDVPVRVELLVGAERALLEVRQLLRRRVLREGGGGAAEERPGRARGHGDGGRAGHLQELAPPYVPRLRGDLGFANVSGLLDQHWGPSTGRCRAGTGSEK